MQKEVQLKSLSRTVRTIIKHDAIQEAFEDLRANPKFIHCRRGTLRAMAKKKVDGMLREQRLMAQQEQVDAERDGQTSVE